MGMLRGCTQVVTKKKKNYFLNVCNETRGNAHRACSLRQTFVELNCSTVNYCFSILIGSVWDERQLRMLKGGGGVPAKMKKTVGAQFPIPCTFSSHVLQGFLLFGKDANVYCKSSFTIR